MEADGSGGLDCTMLANDGADGASVRSSRVGVADWRGSGTTNSSIDNTFCDSTFCRVLTPEAWAVAVGRGNGVDDVDDVCIDDAVRLIRTGDACTD